MPPKTPPPRPWQPTISTRPRQVYQEAFRATSCSATVTTNCLLATTIHCYNDNYASCSTSTVSSPITQTDAYTELPTTPVKIRLSEVTYNAYGLLTGDKEYNYGVTLGSAPSSTYLLSNTAIGYYAVTNGIASMGQTGRYQRRKW